MFKKILIPTDGSPLSAQAANAGVSFARSVNAEIVALHVTQPFAATIGFDGMAAAYAITDDAYEKASAEQAAKYLDAVTSRADTAGVKSTALSVSNFNVADGIVQAAAETGCDLIFIGRPRAQRPLAPAAGQRHGQGAVAGPRSGAGLPRQGREEKREREGKGKNRGLISRSLGRVRTAPSRRRSCIQASRGRPTRPSRRPHVTDRRPVP